MVPAATLVAGALLLGLGPRAADAGDVPVEREIEQIRQEMKEMQRQHDAEMRALREELRRQHQAQDRSELQADVEEYLRSTEAAGREGEPPDTVFTARGLGLQALNPEISVVGDMLTSYTAEEGERGAMGFEFRVLDLHIESYLDPYTKLKAAVGIDPHGAHLGEAYMTRFAVLPGFSVTAGKFRQQFGIVNRWHKHALDQVDFPLALRSIFGNGGLNQIGFSFDWVLPEWKGSAQKIVMQITGGSNSRLFGQNPRYLPSILLRYAHYRDLSKDTYVEAGVTGLLGWNDEWEVTTPGGPEQVHDLRTTYALGLDLTVNWEPTARMRYANLEWRTEFYYLDKGIVAPDGSGADSIRAWGAYTSLQYKLSRTVDVGVRFDWYRPDTKSYATFEGIPPHAVTGSNPYAWQVGPYVTWWQSPFVRVRFEIDYLDGNETGPGTLAAILQLTFAAGPHKHERY
jgi:hypothetical protein